MAEGTRWGLAMLLACPACAGGFVVAVGTVFGVTAAALKGALLFAVLFLLGGLWLRGFLVRRREECEACPVPAPTAATATGTRVED